MVMQNVQDSLESTVEDVYDLAAEIGKEFEVIIDAYGAELISKLMPKVISVLERLEYSSIQTDSQRTQIANLQSKIADLEKAKLSNAENRIKFEVEMEQIEEFWRKENNTLSDMLKRLKDDNDRLHSELRFDADFSCNCDCLEQKESKQVTQVMTLRNELLKYKSKFEQFAMDYDTKLFEITKIQEEFAVANQQIGDLNKLLRHLQLENSCLHEQKQDLERKIEQQNCDITGLKEQLQRTMKENMDLMCCSTTSHQKESNSPKFSLLELRNILIERNSLKYELQELRSELFARKSDQISKKSPDEEKPVQGPINREPDEKLFPERKRSLILKL